MYEGGWDGMGWDGGWRDGCFESTFALEREKGTFHPAYDCQQPKETLRRDD